MAAANHDQLLNQLQHEVNEVWKQMGRLFAAVRINENGRSWPTGHVVNLKKMLPRSDERFHAALDALEDELQMAKLVLRRDLAICRERAGLQVPSAADTASAATAMDISDAAEPETSRTEALDGTSASENTVMEDSEPVKALNVTVDAATEERSAENEGTTTEEAPAAGDIVSTDSNSKPNVADTANAAPERNLHLDTQAQLPQNGNANETPADEDKPPDTASFSTTNDLDSLFGGPLSAGAGESNTFTIDPNATDDFDFDAFSAGFDANNTVENDNISSLLPGLEDYASGPAAGDEEINFDGFFGSVGDAGEAGDQPNIPHRDSTFDGLQDLADFNIDEFTGGGDGSGTADGQDFEFDFLND